MSPSSARRADLAVAACRAGGTGARRLAGALLALAVCGSSTGCVETALREGREPADYGAVDVAAPEAPTEGGVWRRDGVGGSFLFYDQKARRAGDLVTVLIVEDARAEGDAETEAKSSRKLDASLSSDVGFQAMLAQPIRGFLGLLGFSNPGADRAEGAGLNVVESEFDSEFAGEGKTGRSGKFKGVVTCRVIDVLPNGVLHVRGRRWITINHEAQYIAIEGLVRREDLGINNSVLSTALAEMRLSYDGVGTVDDKQRPGWLARTFDWIYPF